MLSVRSLSRVIGHRAVVSEVSFDMAPGEIVAVLGPSGSGKTSLLRMIAGFDAPTSGSVHLHGREASVAGRVLVAPEHRVLALAFQDATLFSHLDAVGNAAFAIRATDKAGRLDKARAALSDMGLTAMDGRDVATLSGGEAQRVSLARALAADAKQHQEVALAGLERGEQAVVGAVDARPQPAPAHVEQLLRPGDVAVRFVVAVRQQLLAGRVAPAAGLDEVAVGAEELQARCSVMAPSFGGGNVAGQHQAVVDHFLHCKYPAMVSRTPWWKSRLGRQPSRAAPCVPSTVL